MEINWLVIIGAGIIPLIIGFIWYHPSVFGKAWMQMTGLTEEKAGQVNMALVFGLTFLLGVFLSLSMLSMTIHQIHMMSTLLNVPGFGQEGTEVTQYFNDFLSKYGNEFRTFKHGAIHGIIGGLFIALPILAINAMFEQKSWKYIAINVGFWIVTMALMGGVVCAWGA
ncbi:MAG: DUF1761 domain-containing protein [Saprospiraceae bacterium]|nr:DUF1761 domain-containing protein [Saprospiraceae bacterium]